MGEPKPLIGDKGQARVKRLPMRTLKLCSMQCSSWKIYLRPKQVEEFYGIKATSLATMRSRREGPDFYRIGKCVVYNKAELDEYFAKRRVRLGKNMQ
jgi:predicted DNA-binding transcriptional regulator AlpA